MTSAPTLLPVDASIPNPILAPVPAEVPLVNAPLVRVIAQVRFPLIIQVEQRDFITAFQQAVQPRYPVLRQEESQGVVFTKDKAMQGPLQTTWRFSDIEGGWRVSLTQNFLAIETTNYMSRADFLVRFKEVLVALELHIKPALIDRLGLRYVDRIKGEPMSQIAQLVRPEVLGIAGVIPATNIVHSISESIFTFNGGQILARWGQLPAGATIDPAAIEPIDEPSWILDLDMFTVSPEVFSVDALADTTERFAERIYTFFRWTVTDDFLRQYGGTL